VTWKLDWSIPARISLRKIPWHDAQRVDAAVQELARTGHGHLVRLPTDAAVTLRLRVAPYFVRMTLDPWEGVLVVWSVYRLDR
jgi:mRNA-degrading endonuclease RelE of RelBE toxin-antitoxin system